MKLKSIWTFDRKSSTEFILRGKDRKTGWIYQYISPQEGFINYFEKLVDLDYSDDQIEEILPQLENLYAKMVDPIWKNLFNQTPIMTAGIPKSLRNLFDMWKHFKNLDNEAQEN